MLKISIIFCLEIHFVNFNLAPDCRCSNQTLVTIVGTIVRFEVRHRKTVTSRITLGMSIYSLKCFEETAQITNLSEFSYFTIIKFRILFSYMCHG